MSQRLLFISNLFPTLAEPYRGLDNATLLHALAPHFEIRVLSPRPTLPWAHPEFLPREQDVSLQPRWVHSLYLPKLGGAINHRLMAASLRHEFESVLRDFRPDVILSSWIFPDSCAALRLARGRVPLVAVAQGSDVHAYLAMPARRRVILDTLPRAAAVVTRSGELSRLLANAGFPREKLRTIYNGVPLDLFRPRDQSEARQKLSLPQDARIILFVGNFYEVKNPFFLLGAFRRLARSSSTGTYLVMAGGGPLEEKCRKLARGDFQAPVIFAGRKTPHEIANLMNAADLLAVPSLNEGVPNVVLEAFASGLPVVASNVGGIPEVLDQPALGRLVKPNDLDAWIDALRRQLDTPRDISAIRAHADRFSWPETAAQYRDTLTAAIG